MGAPPKNSKKGSSLVLHFLQKVAMFSNLGHCEKATFPKFGHGIRQCFLIEDMNIEQRFLIEDIEKWQCYQILFLLQGNVYKMLLEPRQTLRTLI